jgi:hypothetical protein
VAEPTNSVVKVAKIAGVTKKLFEVIDRKTGRKTKIEAKTLREALNFVKEKVPTKLDEKTKVFEGKRSVIKTLRGNVPFFQSAPKGFTAISTIVDGRRKSIHINNAVASEWVGKDPILNRNHAYWLNILSGNFLLKPMATGLNPAFALTNIPRDLAHIFLTTEEFSEVAPVATLQMGKDMAETVGDALGRKGLFERYINAGGGFNTLTYQGRVTDKIRGPLRHFQEVMGFAGEFSETWTRLSLFNRALKNGKTDAEAAFIARNYLDFSQGGDVAKAVDRFIPYFNASIQGSRGIFRTAINKPALFAFKSAQIMGLSAALYHLWKEEYPEAYDDISERDKINNWLFPLPISFLDKEGNRKWAYYKVAKDQGQRVIATFAENIMKRHKGEEFNISSIITALEDLLPIVPTGLMPPTMDAVVGYLTNKDFFRNEDIWKGEPVRSELEKTRFTPDVFVTVGEKTGLSPIRLQYATQQLFTHGNIWTSAAGYGYNKIFGSTDKETSDKVQKHLLERISRMPFARRFIGTTFPANRQKNLIKQAVLADNSARYVLKMDIDDLVRDFLRARQAGDATQEVQGMVAFSNTLNERDREFMERRVERIIKLENIDDPGYWFRLSEIKNPRIRALVYMSRWRGLNAESKIRLDANLFKIAERKLMGFGSEKFLTELILMKKKTDEALEKELKELQ